MALQNTNPFPLRYPTWLEGVPAGAFADTELPAETFVLVIGGGLAGIATAYHLAARGLGVVLLEQGRLCGGASGRNGGLIAPGRGDFGELVDQYGLELAAQIVRFEGRSAEGLLALTQELGIAADLHFGGHAAVALNEGDVARVRRSAELLSQSELPGEVWDRQECLVETGSPYFLGALVRPNGGTLSPGKLGLGLAEAAAGLGAKIRTHTQLLDVQQESYGNMVAITTGGNIRAEHLVFATNSIEARFLPPLAGMITAVRGQVLATRPLERRAWDFGLASIDGLTYWHQDAAKRIVLGGMRHVALDMERDVTDLAQTNPRVGEALRRFLQEHFPGVVREEPQVVHEWNGIMWVPRDGLPLVGCLSLPGYYHNLWLMVGFGSHGMPVIPGAALALSQMIARETPENFVEAFRPSPERFEGSV